MRSDWIDLIYFWQRVSRACSQNTVQAQRKKIISNYDMYSILAKSFTWTVTELNTMLRCDAHTRARTTHTQQRLTRCWWIAIKVHSEHATVPSHSCHVRCGILASKINKNMQSLSHLAVNQEICVLLVCLPRQFMRMDHDLAIKNT